MNTRHFSLAMLAALASFSFSPAASAQERLPWGAIKAGNKEGTIPAWDGGMSPTTNVPGFKKDSGFWPDPFAADKVEFSISAKNLDQYADKLSEGIKEMLKRNPDFRLDVYPTRRTANYPSWFIDNAIKNAAGRCKTIENGEALTGCFGGTPFPVPKTGYEAMWDLILVYKGASTWNYGQGWFVDGNGNKVFTSEVNNRGQADYYNKDLTLEQFYAKGGLHLLGNNINTAPSRVVGEGTVQKKWLNPVANPDKSWSYAPGQRRVRLSPDTQYDFPVATAAGAMMYDEIFVFNGRMDRYDWKYQGVKEMYVPYNAYKYFTAKPDELLMKGHFNPSVVRWELHRVHVVEATLKPGARHVVPKRRFYFAEDVPAAALVDGWDANGKLSRATVSPAAWAWDKQTTLTSGIMYFDLSTNAWYVSSMPGAYKGVFLETDKVDADSFYSPEGLARRAVR